MILFSSKRLSRELKTHTFPENSSKLGFSLNMEKPETDRELVIAKEVTLVIEYKEVSDSAS